MAQIQAQVVRRRTAQQLWDLAAGQVLVGPGPGAGTALGLVAERQIQHELATALPALLDVDEDEQPGREALVQRWDGSLTDLLATVTGRRAS